jgi:hypothetical protein
MTPTIVHANDDFLLLTNINIKVLITSIQQKKVVFFTFSCPVLTGVPAALILLVGET